MFDELAELPGTKEVFGQHNPIRELPNWLSGDAGGELLRFFQKIDADTGDLVHDFTDPEWDTRFLGDLYQDLSEAARKKYALLQTPEFVEEFILERTLEPAIEEFGLEVMHWSVVVAKTRTVTDTTDNGPLTTDIFPDDRPGLRQRAFSAGELPPDSGALAEEGAEGQAPRTDPADARQHPRRGREPVRRGDRPVSAAADGDAGRGDQALADAPAYRIHLAVGDSLMHGRPGGDQLSLGCATWTTLPAEDRPALQQLLAPGRYHAVVANPPYITPKDRALNERTASGTRSLPHEVFPGRAVHGAMFS